MSEQVAVSIVSAISGIIIAYIVNVAAQKVQKRRINKQPKDRMEAMFDGYERLILQKDKEDERKARLMEELEAELAVARDMVKRLEAALNISQKELELSRRENKELSEALAYMRREYELKKQIDLNTEE